MAKEVAIKVSVNGTQQAVRSIDDLETAVGQLREQLKGTAIGSEEFKKLSGELQNAESKLKTLNKSFEGLEPQAKAEAFVKLGEGIAGSFAIATAAITAFGVESEDVEKAQLAVQQALTAAIGFRQIAEAGLQARVVATTIAQKAYNLAATAGNTITKAFYTTIAANPIGAVVVAVAALAAGIYALVKAQEEEIKISDVINDKLNESEIKTAELTTTTIALNDIIQDETKSQEQRQRALNELSKKLPELNGLTLDQEDAILKVNTAVERNIKLIQQRAKAEVLSQLIIEKTKELIENQNSSLDDNVGFWEEGWLRLKNQFNPILSETAIVVAGLNNKQEKQNEIQEDINDITKTYTELLDDLLILEEEQQDVIEETNEAKKKSNEQDKLAIELSKLRQQAIREELAVRRQVISITQQAVSTPEIINQLTKELETLKSVIGQAFPDTFQDNIDKIFAIPTDKVDEFGLLFTKIVPFVSKSFLEGAKAFDEEYNKAINQFAEKLVRGEITQEAFQAGVDVLNNYKKLQNEIDKKPDFFAKAFNRQQFFDLVKDLKVASGVITTDIEIINGEIVGTTATTTKSLSEATTDVGNFIQTAIKQYVKLALASKDEQERIKQLGETQAQATKRLTEEAQIRINNIILLGDTIINTEQQVETFLLNTQKILSEINETTGEARFAVFLTESENIIQAAGFEVKERQRLFGLLKSEVEDFASFRVRTEKELLELIPEFEQLTAEQRLKVLEEYYKKAKELRDNNSDEEKTKTEEFVEGLSEGLRQITQVAQTGVEVFQQYLTTTLTLLEAREEAILAQIVGDSEEAEKKRTEIQEQYENERKEITKRSQIAQLELTRIQAVANVAEAVSKALTTGPLIGQILAGVSAALGAVQVGIITNQISQVRNLAQGGLLFGPSHEYGGIPLAGGAVVAEGGEAVINRRASIDYRGLLSEANMSSGGSPLISTSFDDTRLIEAISKQNRTPIKAYVLEQEISRSQSVNKRLQQLSKI